jgi:hypothetical protein
MRPAVRPHPEPVERATAQGFDKLSPNGEGSGCVESAVPHPSVRPSLLKGQAHRASTGSARTGREVATRSQLCHTPPVVLSLSTHPSVLPEPVEGPVHPELVEGPEPVEGPVHLELVEGPEPVEGPVHPEPVEESSAQGFDRLSPNGKGNGRAEPATPHPSVRPELVEGSVRPESVKGASAQGFDKLSPNGEGNGRAEPATPHPSVHPEPVEGPVRPEPVEVPCVK